MRPWVMSSTGAGSVCVTPWVVSRTGAPTTGAGADGAVGLDAPGLPPPEGSWTAPAPGRGAPLEGVSVPPFGADAAGAPAAGVAAADPADGPAALARCRADALPVEIATSARRGGSAGTEAVSLGKLGPAAICP